jgi:hypothetical protein
MLFSACGRSRQTHQSDYYDLESKNEPTCGLCVNLSNTGDSKRLVDTVALFAKAHQLPLIPGQAVTPDGRVLPPMFGNDDVLIDQALFDFAPVPKDEWYGQVRICVVRRSYPLTRFLALADDFHRTFEREFGSQVRDWEPPTDGINELK